MTILAESTGNLIERHEVLYVNGVRYLLEPVRDVSFREIFSLLGTSAKLSGSLPQLTILAQHSPQSLTLEGTKQR